MNKVSLLAASVAIALAGCGGSDGGSKTPVEAGGIVITAIDGYLQNAKIFVDKDGDLKNGCEHDTGIVTGENGKATINKSDFAGMNVCIKAIAGQTIDNDRGLVAKGFDLASPASESNNVIVNPMTNMIIEQMANNSELTPETAKDEVVKAITGTGLKADADMIFGDYLANSSDEAKALKVIGETLVDNNDKSVETQLAISTEVASDTNEIIINSGELDNYAPVVEVTPEGGVTVKPNSRPVVDVTPEAVTMLLGDAWVTVDASKLFSDADGDTLTYTMKALGGDKNGLDIVEATGLITGTPKVAGEFIYQIFAEDTKGSLSYPANLKVTIETPNTAPTHSPEALETIQTELNALTLTQGDEVNETIAATGLFTDVDGDSLKYNVENVPAGMSVTLDKDELTLTGTPSSHGEFTLGLFANDGVNQASAEASLTLMIEESVTPPQENSFENKLHYLSPVESLRDGNGNYMGKGVVCEVRYFDSETKHLYAYNRTRDNYSECPIFTADVTPSTDSRFEDYGSYSIDESGQFVLTLEEDGGEILIEYKVEPYKDYFMVYGKETFTRTDDGAPLTQVTKQLYPAFTNGDHINAVLAQLITDGWSDQIWSERRFHYINSENQLVEMKVDASMNDVPYNCPTDHCGPHDVELMDADIHFTMSCDDVKSIYKFSIETLYDGNGPLYYTDITYYPKANGLECGIDFTNTISIPSGIHSLIGEVKGEYQGKYEDIAFSFLKD